MCRLPRAFGFCLALTLLLPSVHLAQSTGTLRGVVADDRGRPLAGVTIVVASSSQGVTGRGAVSDSTGTFHVVSLPAARDYFVRASFPGFATLDYSEVEIKAGQTTALRLTLPPETPFRERVEVRARPQVVNLESTTTETRLTSEFIDALPILGRNYQDILALAPGVTDTDGDGNPNIHGARDTDVITLVDGVSTTDPLTGKMGAQLNIESIQEIEIKTSGATAEFSRAQGGFANIITKSGGNEFKGTFKFFWRGQALDGDGAGTDDPRLHGGLGEQGLRDLGFNDFMPFLSLEGPIVKDRAWFFTAHEYVQQEDPVNAVNTAFVAGKKEFREFAKVTWQATPNNRLALSLNYDPQKYLNQGLNSLTRVESGYTSRQGGPILTAKLTTVLNPYIALETSLSRFDERPSRTPTLDPDTNDNGILFLDRNQNRFIEASERDPGEDYDLDGAFDVFEDFNRNKRLDPNEDLDGDGRLTQPRGCEGTLRENLDCDGRLDTFNEDRNGNGVMDPFEDIDGDGHLDPGTEDRNGNFYMDDAPFPASRYPYGDLVPQPSDRDFTIDQRLGVTSGPYYLDFADKRRRVTLRQDLSLSVPDYWGSHDLKLGYVVEKEDFERATEGRPILAPILRTRRQGPSTVRALLPSERRVENDAHAVTGGLYAQDIYKPFPNMTIGFGLRFDREADDTFGYSFFEPVEERALYDRLLALAGGERDKDDFLQGNNDGIRSLGITGDPIFSHSPVGLLQAVASRADPLRVAAISRLTRHHTEARFTSNELTTLFPDVLTGGEADPRRLLAHGVLPQQRERFRLTNNNLAPRLSFSWDPASNGRTKLFATWGRFYDKLFLSTLVGEEGPDTINRYYFFDADGITGSGTPNHQIGGVLSKAPPSATQVDRGLRTPFSDELTVGFERELAPELALAVTYINRKYRDQLQDVDVNHTLRFYADTGEPRDDIGATQPPAGAFESGLNMRLQRLPDGKPDLYIYNFFFNQVLRVGNTNEARYTGLEVQLTKRLSRRWEMQGSYTYSRAIGSAESFDSRLGDDPSTIEQEFGYLDYDQRHVVKLNATTFLPGDWQVGAVMSWSSGLPYSVISRFFALDNVDYQQFRTRFGYSQKTTGNQAKFVPELRNSRRNDPVLDVNLLAKKALVVGRYSSALFLEVYNLLNRDDLRIYTYEPDRADNLGADELGVRGPLQVDAGRRFGRRFQVGFQFEF
ncbi:MAG: carboxypeptidase regulatory-like domain-containing protein [Acidobacteria bacterium]|nr:carboxypeptidase regulatory-like domain-containing protein [Acidobacteriota bacterium]